VLSETFATQQDTFRKNIKITDIKTALKDAAWHGIYEQPDIY
jgi:hypothetical protein